MLIIRRIAALIFALTVAVGFNYSAAEITTEGAKRTTERNYCFDDDRLLIGGYNFDLTKADDDHVKYVKDAGIDFLISGANKDFLDLCEKYDIGVIASGYNAPALYCNGDTSKWYEISRSNYTDHPALWGDDLIDEPVSTMYEELGRVTDHYYSHTTGKLPLINLFPNYANNEQLGEKNGKPMKNELLEKFIFGSSFLGIDKKEYALFGSLSKYMSKASDYTNEQTIRYVRYVQDYINNINTDYISVDIYPLDADGKTMGCWLRNLDILAQACKKTNKKLWVITQASGTVEGGKRYCDNVNDIRWQMYTSLSFGTRAIIHACYNGGWWDTDSHIIDAAGNRTATYYAVQQADSEVAAFADIYDDYKYTGTFLCNPLLAEGTDSGYITPMAEDAGCTVKTASPVLVGCFKKSGGRAYTFVNMKKTGENNKASLNITFDGASEITVYRKGKAETLDENNLKITLDNEEGIYVTVK